MKQACVNALAESGSYHIKMGTAEAFALTAPVLYSVFVLSVRFCFRDVFQVSIDKAVDLAVHDRVDVSVLVAGSGVLSESVGHKYVAADLTTPLDVCLVALNVLNSVELFAELDLEELGFKHFDSGLLVLELAALGLAANNDTGRLMHDSDSRVRSEERRVGKECSG